MFTHHRRLLLLLVGLAVGATSMARPDSACADNIFVPGATRVSATFAESPTARPRPTVV